MDYIVKIVNIDEKSIILDMIDVYNKAFSERKNIYENNPFTKVDPCRFYETLKADKKQVVIAAENDKVIGGVCFQTKHTASGKNIYYISNVCVDPESQGKGVAKAMLKFVIKQAQEAKCDYLELSVGSVWKNAVKLYGSLDFIPVDVSAHLPETYYLIKMKRFLRETNMIKVKISYLVSKIKFSLLFRKDSSPKLLHKIIFK